VFQLKAERVFYCCGGNIVTDKRSYLEPDNVDSLEFIALNMRD